MKKIVLLCAASICLLAAGCASKPAAGADKTTSADGAAAAAPAYVMPADVLSGSQGIDELEAKSYATFAAAEFKPWNLDGAKNYLVDTTFYSKVQSEGPDWARDITKKKLALIKTGDDNIVSMNLDLSAGAKEIVYAYLFNVSSQATEKKDLSSTVMKVKFYIPSEMTKEGAASYPILRVVVRDGSWNQAFLEGQISELTTDKIGAGWHIFEIDFTKSAFKIGNASGSFDAVGLKTVNSVDFNFYAKGIPASMNVPMYMDWVSFDGMKNAQ